MAVLGGLFLAFPGIFPTGVSLAEKHKTLREKAEGKLGIWSARGQARVEATGTSVGTLGLMGFAAVLWQGLPTHNFLSMMFTSTGTWIAASSLLVDTREDVDFAFRCDMNASASESDASCTLKECINLRTSLNWSVFR